MPQSTLKLFDRAFVKGQTRPTAEEWQAELDFLLKNAKRCKKNPNHVYFTNKGCGLCVADEKLKVNLKSIQEKKAEPKKIRGFEVNKLSLENLEKDKLQHFLNEKKARQITYFSIMFYSIFMTFWPRIMYGLKDDLKQIGVSVQLIVYILFLQLLHFVVKRFKRVLVKRVGSLTISALITYTYCCIIVAICLGNDIEWSRLFRPF